MVVMFLAWKVVKRSRFVGVDEMDFVTDRWVGSAAVGGSGDGEGEGDGGEKKERGALGWARRVGMWLIF